ncbi:MAG TPA: orotidine-5'-phosphate decarboxylase [Candidatus Methanoperedens sp.]
MKSLLKKMQLILALDVTDKARAVSLSKDMAGCVDAIKIGYPLVLSAGVEIIDKISEISPVIADFKVADIPNTSRMICTRAFEAGACAVIVHGFTGRDSLVECVNTGREYGGGIFVVTEMSHPGAIDFMQQHAPAMARLAVESGASGVVAPATRPERVRKIRNIVGDMTIISPGVGVQGGSAAGTIKAGADYVIVGRSIYDSRNPKLEAQRIAEEIEKCR